MTAELRYVALGDSYTIGTAVGPRERWPDQLVARLAADPPPRTLTLAANLGANGFTSRDVIRGQLPRLRGLDPGFVSLLVGVNDVVQGVPADVYRVNVATILDDLRSRLPPGQIVGVETPDYTVTPAGSDFGDPAERRARIENANRILAVACQARRIAFVGGIFEVSQAAGTDPGWVAADGLHPSGAQYARWVDRIEPVVRALLGHA